MRLALWLGIVAVTGCTSGPAVPLQYPVEAMAEGAAPIALGNWTVQLTRADIGLGPIYFCAGVSAAGDLCRAALSEFASSATIDGLSSVAQPLGEADGTTGNIRSATYDFAIGWTLTQSNPTPLAGAPGGHSLVLVGTATRGPDTLGFEATLDIVPQHQDAHGIESTVLRAALTLDTRSLTVSVRPREWASAIDFDALFVTAAGAPNIVLQPGSAAYEALRLSMMVNRAPTFVWESF